MELKATVTDAESRWNRSYRGGAKEMSKPDGDRWDGDTKCRMDNNSPRARWTREPNEISGLKDHVERREL